MAEKYIELNLDDEKASIVAEVLANRTAKKILSLLADEELSESDIAKRLKIAANTVNYNIKKLIDAGLIEKSKNFFWSIKGKKILTYKLSNKKIIISTKNSFAWITASAIIGAALFGAGKFGMNYYNSQIILKDSYSGTLAEEYAPALMTRIPESTAAIIENSSLLSNVLIYALIGVIAGVLAFFIFRKLKGGSNKIRI